MDDINHTSQVGTQLYMSPEQVIIYQFLRLFQTWLRYF